MLTQNTKARMAPCLSRLLLLLSLLCVVPLAAADGILPAPKKISPHVYAWIGPYEGPNKTNQGFRMNMAFVVGQQAVAVIDTGYTAAMAEEMRDHIKRITPLPIKYAINTNSQPHRFMGNDVFKRAGATLITHPKERERMANMSGVFTQGVENALGLPADSVVFPTLPDMMVDQKTSLDLGGLAIDVTTHGASHTPASLVVHIPTDNVVYAGDVLYSGRLLAVLPDGSVSAWIKTFNALRDYNDVVFIPGHGQPDKLAAFEFPTLSYLQLLHDHMTRQVEAGADVQAAINSLDQSAYNKLVNFEQLAGRNASWAYLEAEAASFD